MSYSWHHNLVYNNSYIRPNDIQYCGQHVERLYYNDTLIAAEIGTISFNLSYSYKQGEYNGTSANYIVYTVSNVSASNGITVNKITIVLRNQIGNPYYYPPINNKKYSKNDSWTREFTPEGSTEKFWNKVGSFFCENVSVEYTYKDKTESCSSSEELRFSATEFDKSKKYSFDIEI